MSTRLHDCIHFGILVHDLARLRHVLADREMKKVGTTWSQWSVLAALNRCDGKTQTELAAELELSKVAIGGLLDRMETAGLVQRQANKLDARSRHVYLTPDGRSVLGRVDKQIEHFAPHFTREVADKDLAVALRVLELVKQNLLRTNEEGYSN